MTARGRVVILNGVGSVGKGSIARALQAITARPFLHVQMDAFLAMLPAPYQDSHPDGLVFETVIEDGHPAVAIHVGPVAARAFQGMRRAVAALAAEGNDLIVDEVMEAPEAADYRALLAGFDVAWVGVHAPLAVIEAREAARGDRMIGLARRQFDRVHRGVEYDLDVDTSRASPEACARAIKERFGL